MSNAAKQQTKGCTIRDNMFSESDKLECKTNDRNDRSQQHGNDQSISNNTFMDKIFKDICDKESITVIQMLEMTKTHPKYEKMQQNKPLTDRELIALILYTYSRQYCRKMKKSGNEWYYDASNAVRKMHEVLHYKNNELQPKMLFHGTENPVLDLFSKEDLFLKRFCSFTTSFDIAKTYATGSILVITRVDERLDTGQLQAADVSWISPWNEKEWIILPTTFHCWREMTKQEIIEQGWIIPGDIKVYITDDYQSNVNPTPVFSSVNNNDHDVHIDMHNEDKSIKIWFDNEFGLKKSDSMKYFNLFVQNGYDTFELIKEIECVDDLNEIGIFKIGHVKKILKTIKKLDEYLDNKQRQRNIELIQEVMDGIDDHVPKMRNEVYLRSTPRKSRISCKCGWRHHDTIPTDQFGPISKEEREHIAQFHPDLHCRLLE